MPSIFFVMICILLPPRGQGIYPTQCTRDHIATAVRAASHCKPIQKVVKLEIPGNGSFTQVYDIQSFISPILLSVLFIQT